VTLSLTIADSILTAYLQAGVEHLPGAQLTTDRDGFVVVEAARIGSLPSHSIHPDVGIVVRDRGVVALQSPVRPDELLNPTVRLRVSGPTPELLARATVGPYFGFRVREWVGEDRAGEAEAVVVDEAAAIAPLESGFRDDLARAWFVLTGLPFVTHLLAVPSDAEPDVAAAIAEWIASGGGLDRDQRRAVREEIVKTTGATVEDITTLMTGIRWQLTLDDRRSVAELFARAGVANQVGPVRWWRNENEPGA
jgi:hypothetical protein